MSNRPPLSARWMQVATTWLPFADAASADLPLARLLRLALFQVSVGMATVLLTGTLNRVMIVELSIPAGLVATIIAIPLLVAPLRALIGHKSDTHRSLLGWRRVPFIWLGTLMQFGGLAIMPFALLLLSAPGNATLGIAVSAVAFLLTGAGLHTTQTAGLALATDLAPPDKRPRAVALLYVMLLAGTMLAALAIGSLLGDFTPTRLVQVIQGAALLTLVLNLVALWKQEPRGSSLAPSAPAGPSFAVLWRAFVAEERTARLLAAIGIGAAAFAMQDALLEPYGGEILGLSVGSTTMLTGAWAAGALAGFCLAGRSLSHGGDPLRLAGTGLVAGIAAFLMVLFASPFQSSLLLFAGATSIGLGLGLFSVGTLTETMARAQGEGAGLALGAWGAVQASCAGVAIAVGGTLRDIISQTASAGGLSGALNNPAAGYGSVYIIEIILLLAALVALGPLVARRRDTVTVQPIAQRFGLCEFPT
ncbi:BCD family MFS transporter [Alteriqipengyuania lutimaris]|uniref:MFS transporter n=1 Tax=Alteriqipengyuania lutimaris TaxID=1538146 RepID=A0A395LJX5_9SPHN|nr:BCD family MFS transporter [Alteriqipengyuania lutimaris]MBB3033778.1 BCD family chlorophyll transporter-like MFS transporter [Alteriqipengyuania lutimaris]RDS77242.1 MFS transporter [Alteriqipengyuania lutimaris]